MTTALVEEDSVSLTYNGHQLPVCYNDVDREMADTFCNMAGKGSLNADGIRHGFRTITDGIRVTPTSEPSVLPGIAIVGEPSSCYPLILDCQIPDCGSPVYLEDFVRPMIIHGDDVLPGEFPWQGSLRYYGGHYCGLTWIGGKWALTAEHCYEPNADNFTRPICLGNTESFQAVIAQGQEAECYVTGFGNQNEDYIQVQTDWNLREVRVDIVPNSRCVELMQFIAESVDSVGYDAVCVSHQLPFMPACNLMGMHPNSRIQRAHIFSKLIKLSILKYNSNILILNNRFHNNDGLLQKRIALATNVIIAKLTQDQTSFEESNSY
ncbi:TEST-like protein [Mya arenaria]|uniref:TEST-like protein n=1 Tax=Mya arenaria TaxID=6604 RepID=A0ABY7F1X4_MYAAR|nr:TEST-like protein [Mya arenaria]